MLLQHLTNGIAAGASFALVAVGFAMIYATTNVFHLAHGAVYTLAAYSFYYAFAVRSWPWALASILALTVACTAGLLCERLVYVPLLRRNSPPAISLLCSLALYAAIVNALALVFGNDTKVAQAGVQTPLVLGSVAVTRIQIVTVVLSVVVLCLLLVVLRVTAWGRLIRAVRDNPELATVFGVDYERARLGTFAVGSLLAGLAAILGAIDVGVDPQAGFSIALIAGVSVIIGGFRALGGAALGALLLGLLQHLVAWQSSTQWQPAVTFALLLLFLLFKPEGLFVLDRRAEEL
jgi:branched-chain amino acid transport system permease protein